MRALIFALACSGCAGAAVRAKPQPSPVTPSQAPPSGKPAVVPANGTRLACSLPSDCGAGKACCTTPLWDGTVCAARCDLANNGQICARDSECPEIGGAKTSCLPVSAEDTPGLPASLRICQ